MIVVVAIFLIITGILLSSLPSFRDSKSLDLVAQEIATAIRQVQVFSLGAKSTVGSTSYIHGIYFATAQPSQLVVFNDGNSNHTYDGGEIVEETFKLPAGVTIIQLKSGVSSLTTANLTFQIPLTEPTIKSLNTDYSSSGLSIKIQKGTKTRTITINQLGQVSITNP